MKDYIKELRQKRKRERKIARNRALICLIVSLFAIVAGATAMTAHGSSGETECIQIVVREGDTLWRLAELYGERGKDVRKTVDAIRTANGMTASDIREGDILRIPVGVPHAR